MLSSSTRAIGQRLGQQALRALSARYFSSSLPSLKEHIVIALGGNAMLKRGEEMTVSNQRKNIESGMASLADIVNNNTVTIVHGNGPQVGLLMLESAAYEKQTGLEQISLDVLDAETEGMLGYMIEQELQSHIGKDRGMVTLLSQIVCDPNDPSMANPTKFVGPVYTKEEADKLTVPIKPDGDYFRRVVPSPLPVKLVDHQMKAVQLLTNYDCVVVCAGGGGIPVIIDPVTGKYRGIEAVIDKDRAATMMGCALNAQGLLILTDVPAVATDFGKPEAKFIKLVAPQTLEGLMDHFPAGSMGPKIESAIEFVKKTAGWAAIGSLREAGAIVAGEAGTTIRHDLPGDFIEFYKQ
jgi:carbamate kinase